MVEITDLHAYRRWNRRVWLILLALFAVAAVFEWQFYFVERAIGRYLVWRNSGREQSGPRWEQANSRLAAGSRLESIAYQRRESERKLEQINTFAQLLEVMQAQTQFELAPVHFERIYNNLPFYLKSQILPPDSLLELGAHGLLVNTLWLRGPTSLVVYFLGRNNEVLTKATLLSEQIEMILRHGQRVNLNIDSEPRFSTIRPFPLARFLRLLQRLDYDTQQNFLQNMPALFQYANPGTRIAISNKITNGLVEVAIATGNFHVFLYYLPEEWINDLVSVLNDEDFRQPALEDFL